LLAMLSCSMSNSVKTHAGNMLPAFTVAAQDTAFAEEQA